MPAKTPPETTKAAIETGTKKAGLRWDKALVASFLAGAYIALAGLLAVVVSSGLKPEIWGNFPTFITGTVFSLGLILVIVAGSELLTGNMALVPMAVMAGRVSIRSLFRNFGIVVVGNILGSVFVAYFLAVKTGVITAPLPLARLQGIVQLKAVTESAPQVFLRGMGANWLVCLAVFMALAAEDVGGKILAIFFPIMGFVALGFDHVIANMFFIPAGIFAGMDVTWLDALRNWLWSGLGNLVGAAVFVGSAYWYLYARDPEPVASEPGDAPSEQAGGVAAGRITRGR
jgi:formate/nitrite transporter